MSRRIPVLTMVAAVAGAALPGLATGAARVACGPASARTIAHDAVARVYATRGSVWGCAAGASRSHQLGMTAFMGEQAGAIHLAGRMAGYWLTINAIDTAYTSVKVLNLGTGRALVDRAATTRVGAEGFPIINSLVVRADGAVAWIATAQAFGPPTFVRQVERVDRRGFRVLDSGRAVAAASLALRGSTLSWDHGGVARTASLY